MDKAYLETTVFSFYYDDRPEAEIVARRKWTRQWWDECKSKYLAISSTAMLTELQQGDKPHKEKALAWALTLPAISVGKEVIEIVEVYLKHQLMPRDPLGDALHLALASFHKCDFLVTWNCQHLANANKFPHIRRVNAIIGLATPALVTPLQLLGPNTYD